MLAGLSGCKQGLGDRCELDSDCESGLRCSSGTTRVCENPSQVVVDASTDLGDARNIADARFIPDGGLPPVPDARPDAPPADAPEVADAPETPPDAGP